MAESIDYLFSTMTDSKFPNINPARQYKLPRYLTGLPTLADWHQQAACSGADIGLFFPTSKGRRDGALRICATCPVIEACRAHADAMPEPFGIWGGATAQERGWSRTGKPPSHHSTSA